MGVNEPIDVAAEIRALLQEQTTLRVAEFAKKVIRLAAQGADDLLVAASQLPIHLATVEAILASRDYAAQRAWPTQTFPRGHAPSDLNALAVPAKPDWTWDPTISHYYFFRHMSAKHANSLLKDVIKANCGYLLYRLTELFLMASPVYDHERGLVEPLVDMLRHGKAPMVKPGANPDDVDSITQQPRPWAYIYWSQFLVARKNGTPGLAGAEGYVDLLRDRIGIIQGLFPKGVDVDALTTLLNIALFLQTSAIVPDPGRGIDAVRAYPQNVHPLRVDILKAIQSGDYFAAITLIRTAQRKYPGLLTERAERQLADLEVRILTAEQLTVLYTQAPRLASEDEIAEIKARYEELRSVIQPEQLARVKALVGHVLMAPNGVDAILVDSVFVGAVRVPIITSLGEGQGSTVAMGVGTTQSALVCWFRGAMSDTGLTTLVSAGKFTRAFPGEVTGLFGGGWVDLGPQPNFQRSTVQSFNVVNGKIVNVTYHPGRSLAGHEGNTVS